MVSHRMGAYLNIQLNDSQRTHKINKILYYRPDSQFCIKNKVYIYIYILYSIYIYIYIYINGYNKVRYLDEGIDKNALQN